MVLYLFTIYVKQHRLVYLLSKESMLFFVTVVPILTMQDLSMMNGFYIFVAISRYMRVPLFCVILLKYYELGETDYDRQINYISITMVNIVLVSSGLFGEIENS
jgi:hypothetical protein